MSNALLWFVVAWALMLTLLVVGVGLLIRHYVTKSAKERR